MRRKTFFALTFGAYIAAILILCLMRPDSMPEKEISFFGLPADKIVHFTMFLPFTALTYLATLDIRRKKNQEIILIAFYALTGIGIAFLTEFLQSLTDYRSADIKDTIANIAGVLTGSMAVISHIILRKPTPLTHE